MLLAVLAPAGALAHGDPTAHYLETDSLLTTYAAPPDTAIELQLRGVLDAAAARGYPIKVALFASEDDTGGESAPMEDPQSYAKTVSDQLEEVSRLRAPVVIVTPERFGVAGRQPLGGTPTPITGRLATELARDLPPAAAAEGNALARAGMVAIRRLAAAGGHPLPARIAPAKTDLQGILGSPESRDGGTVDGPWLIVAVVIGSVLLGALLFLVHRRTAAKLEPDT